MAVPKGRIVHLTSSRIRIRFPEKRNDTDFFQALEKPLKNYPAIKTVRSNPLAASLLLEGQFSDPRDVAGYAESKKLFLLDPQEFAAVPLRKKVYQSFNAGDRFIKDHTRQELDLPVLIFLLLLGSGIYQLFRSEVRLPPWYTAFWYALGVFTKSLSELDAADDAGE